MRRQTIVEIAIAAVGVFALFAMGGGWVGLVMMLIAAGGAAIWAVRRVA
jgi:hypothetical protein